MISRRLARFRRLGDGELSARGLVVLECLAIVFAIALGFWVNEWRESRVRARVVDSALRGLARELDYNQQQAESTWVYYRAILREIDALPTLEPDGEGRSAVVYGYQLAGWKGAMPPLLRSSSFATMASTGALADLPFDSADQLARVYNFQSVIERLDSAALVQVVNDPGLHSRKHRPPQLWSLPRDVALAARLLRSLGRTNPRRPRICGRDRGPGAARGRRATARPAALTCNGGGSGGGSTPPRERADRDWLVLRAPAPPRRR